MTATATRPNTRPMQTCESLGADYRDRVDRERRIIRRVKVLGKHSRNPGRFIGLQTNDPYSYTDEALRGAVRLLEGIGVNRNHPRLTIDADGTRKPVGGLQQIADDRLGVLRNVTLESDGIYADLHYLPSHELIVRVLESIEGGMDLFALSINGLTRPEMRNGKPVVSEIATVFSVDLIGETGGTTRNLFESGDVMDPATMKEDEAPTVEMEGEAAATGMTLDEAVKALQLAVLNDENIDSVTAIKEIEKLIAKLKGSDESESDDSESSDSSESETPATESAGMSLAKFSGLVKTLESSNVKVTSARVSTLAKAPDEIKPELIRAWESADRASQRKPPSGSGGKPKQATQRSAADLRAMAQS